MMPWEYEMKLQENYRLKSKKIMFANLCDLEIMNLFLCHILTTDFIIVIDVIYLKLPYPTNINFNG